MTSQLTQKVKQDGSKLTESAEVNARESKALQSTGKPEECLLKVTGKLGRHCKTKASLETRCSSLDSTSKQTLPLAQVKLQKHLKNHGLQADSTDLRRYSRACKEKKDDSSQNELRRTKRQQTNTRAPSQLKKAKSVPPHHRSARNQPMRRKRQVLSIKMKDRSPQASSNTSVSPSLDVQSLKRKSEDSLSGSLNKRRNQGLKAVAQINRSKLQSQITTKTARMEKIKAQEKLSSRLKSEKARVRGRGPLETELIKSGISPGNARTRKAEKLKQTNAAPDVKPEKDESSPIDCYSETVEKDVKFKKPRKIDKRSKRFRRMKAEALLNSQKTSNPVENTEDENSGSLTPTLRDQNIAMSVSHVKEERKPMVGDKTDTPTKLPSQSTGPKRKYRRKRAWWKDKRRGPVGRQDMNKLHCVDRIQNIPSISVNHQLCVDSDKTDLAVGFEEVLQGIADAQPESLSTEQVVRCDDDAKDSAIKLKSGNKSNRVKEENLDVKKVDTMGQGDGEMDLDGSEMEVSQSLSLPNPEVHAPPEIDTTDVSTLATHVVVGFDVKSTRQGNVKSNEFPTNNSSPASRSETVPHSQPSYQPTRGGRRRRGGGPMKCEYCGRVFIHMSAYVIHRRIHTGEKPHSCNICGKAFAQRSNLNAHMRTHQGVSSLQCCGEHFSSKSALRDHSKTHNKVTRVAERSVTYDDSPDSRGAGKPCPCPICGKIFRYRSMLKTHMRVHSGEKPFSCKVCGKSFSQATTVRVHERIHWSVKPYVCPKCGRGFSQLGTLKVHACKAKSDAPVSAAVAYRCHLCHKCFTDKHLYELHVQSHTDTQQYACGSCGERFSLQSELLTHRFYCSQMKSTDHRSPSPDSPPLSPSPPNYSLPSSPPQSPSHQHLESPLKLQSLANVEIDYFGLKPKLQPNSNQEENTRHKRQLPLLTSPVKLMTDSVDKHLSAEKSSTRSSIVSQLNNLDQKSDPRKYFCPRCGRLFRHVMRLRAHMLTHSQNEGYTCGCGKTLQTWRQFWQHQRVHRQRKGRFFCPKCTQGFRFASSYHDHLREHPELNAYACPLCPLTFFNSDGLRAHQRDWHKKTLPYICDTCGKGFNSQRTLDRHSVSHRTVGQMCFEKKESDEELDIMPYQCAKCDLTFKTIDLLFQHQLCHSSEDKLSGSTGGAVSQNQLNRDQYTNITSPCLNTNSTSQTLPATMNSASAPQEVSTPLDPVPLQNSQSSIPKTGQETSTSLQNHPQHSPSHSSTSPLSNEHQLAKHTSLAYEKTSKSTQHLVDSIPAQDHVYVVDKGVDPSCADCGAVFTGVSELFEHYLLHARGEV